MSIRASDLQVTFEGADITEYTANGVRFTYDKRRAAVGYAEGGHAENMTWHILPKNTKTAAKTKAVEIYNREYI